MRNHFSNAIYGVLDYLAYPAGMLAVAPIALRALGLERFGVWMIATSAVTTGAIIASGFGDANIRYVAMQRALGNNENLLRAVRSTMGIHLVLGCAMAVLGWLLAPLATSYIVSTVPGLRLDCLWSLRIAALMMLMRAIESVCISTQRALERYGAAVQISVIARLLSLAVAAILPFAVHTVTGVMTATAAISLVSIWLQIQQLCTLLNSSGIMPSFDRNTTNELLEFGIFAWIQAVSGLLFGQVDRLVTGLAFGAATVSSYAMCVQLSQPIYGVAAAGLHFLFPHISAQYARNDFAALRRSALLAFCANVVIVAVGTAALLVFGETILRIWGGEAIVRAGRPLLPPIVWSTALSGLSVAGCYSMFALRRVRIVTWFCLTGGAMMTLAMLWLPRHYGIYGMACARLFYGPVTLVAYIPLLLLLNRRSELESRAVPSPEILQEAR